MIYSMRLFDLIEMEVVDMTYQNHQYLTEVKVSEITGRALSTLRNDRHQRRGITYHKIGRSVRYSLRDVIEFMERHKIETREI